ncbi:MAG: DUF1801 domain-containing protein [Candidatus Thermoplasmatota archaeon]|nr:DUF1801 domain-containing protein [Candidatus Thermoplasmatota archaeon]
MDKAVDEYIKKQKSPQKEICTQLQRIILTTFPTIKEELKVGVPCYGCSPKDSCGNFYIAALKDHVNLGFSLRGLTKKQHALFQGGGKTMKHIKVYCVEEIDESNIIRLLKMVRKT